MRVPSGGTLIRDLGEFELIEQLRRTIGSDGASRLVTGIGDDAAVWTPRPDRPLVMTTDMLVENIDFRFEWTDWQSLGHKALAVNLSDIAAMGARPRLALVSLGLRGTERDREIYDLYRGMQALANQHGVHIVGGDISEAPSGVVLSVTVLGEGLPGKGWLLSRSTSKPGDLLGVTGSLGLAAGGLRVLAQDLRTIDGGPAMREAFNRPKPRIREGRLLVRAGVRAGMDISDGLMGDLPKLLESSNVSATIEEVRLPIPMSLRWSFPDWFDLALRGGEDFELLFSAPPAAFGRATKLFRRVGLRPPVQIGEITKPGKNGPEITLRRVDASKEVLETGAFSHFRHG